MRWTQREAADQVGTAPAWWPGAVGRLQRLRPLVGNRSLAHFAASWGAWVAADTASLVVLSVVAYTDGGLAAVGLLGAARALPTAVAAPWGAVLTDRYSRVRVLAAMHALAALELLAFGLAAALHWPLPVLCALVALGTVLSAPARPATSALVPQLVTGPEELTGANALYSSTEAAATLLGPACAGVLLATAAPAVACLVIALLSVAGAAVTLGIKMAGRGQAARARDAGRLRELVAGVEALLGEPRVAAIFGLVMGQTAMRGLLNVFVVAAAVSLLGLGEAGAGGLLSLLGLGGLLGAGLSFGLVTGGRLALPFAGGVAAWGLAVLAIALWPTPGVAWLVLAGVGLGNAIEDVAGLTILHRLVPDERLGQAFGFFWGMAAASLAAGSLGASVLVAALGLRGAMGLSGAVLILLVLGLWGQVRRADAAAADQRPPVHCLRRPPLRAWLPRLSLLHLACLLGALHPHGRPVIPYARLPLRP